jgi:predicted Zn finger-like uncharacterized protein
MIITCENCHTSYNLDDSLLDPAGSRVRCTNCGHVFLVQPPPEVQPPADDEPVDALGEGTSDRTFEAPAPVGTESSEFDFQPPDTPERDERDALALDLDLDLDFGEPEHGVAARTDDLEELELDLNLDPDPVVDSGAKEAVQAAPSDEIVLPDELVLEDIEKLLQIQEAPGAVEKAPAAVGQTDVLEGLDLNLEQPEEAGQGREAGSQDSDLNLDLDLNLEEAGTRVEAPVAGSQDLDLDLDLNLEEIEGLPEMGSGGEGELELRLEPLGTEPMQMETEVFEEKGIDLGDIDQMLHGDEDAMESEKTSEQVEETAVEMPPIPIGQETAEIAANLMRTGEPEAEVDVYGEETGAPRDSTSDAEIASLGHAYTLRASTEVDGQTTLTAETEPITAPEAVAAPAGRSLGWLWVVLVLLGLAGGGVYWAQRQGVDLAFLSRLVGKQAVDEAGNMKISTLAIDSRFVDNTTAGRLFVISGKVRNDYDHPRSRIQIKGSLLAKGKKLVGSEMVFCGNVLTDLDLNRLDVIEIKKRLALDSGTDNSNLDVAPGGLVPFMVVFSNLPSDLEEFTIEVVSSR